MDCSFLFDLGAPGCSILYAWIPLALGALSAASALGGSFISASGAASANAQNVAAQNMANQQMLNAQMAQHEQNTGFMEDSQAHQLYSQHMAQDFNALEAEKARAFNSIEARVARDTQMQFQERMATNAYQYAMEDMRKAGLNPMLAYKMGGAAAGAGSGAAASGAAASGAGGSAGMASSSGGPNLRAANVVNDKDALGRGLGNVVTSAVDTMRTLAGVDQMKADEKLKDEQTRRVGYETGKLDAETGKVLADTNVSKQQEQNLQIENAILRANAVTAVQNARISAADAEASERYGGKFAPGTFERIIRSIQGSVESSTVDPGILERQTRKYLPDPEAVKRAYRERMERKAPWE